MKHHYIDIKSTKKPAYWYTGAKYPHRWCTCIMYDDNNRFSAYAHCKHCGGYGTHPIDLWEMGG